MGTVIVLTGRVDYLDNSIVGRRQVMAMYQKLDSAYAQLEHQYVG
jgi:hypothetical protein